MKTMKEIGSYRQAYALAQEFQRVTRHPGSIAFAQLGKFYHWYYFEKRNIFAPSKFIGYAGTTIESYESEGSGTKTTRALDEFFKMLPRPSQSFDMLAERLAEWLLPLGKRPSEKMLSGSGGIYVSNKSPGEATDFDGTSYSTRGYFEGKQFEMRQTRFERNPQARQKSIEHHGCRCKACFADFEARYGILGRGYIHVHHLQPLSVLRKPRKVDPIKDLIPLCPNCHAMIHKLHPPQTLKALKKILRFQDPH